MSAEKKKKGSYSVGLATREAILSAASDMIAEVGYHAMSLRDLARRVGISHPAVIYHFPNKETMIRQIMLRYEETVGVIEVDCNERDGSLIPKQLLIEDLNDLGIMLMRLAAHPDAEKLMTLSSVIENEAGSVEHPLHEYIQKRRKMIDDFCVNLVVASRDAGQMKIMVNPTFVARSMLLIWTGTKQSDCRPNRESDATDRVAIFLATCVIYLRITPDTLLQFSATLPEELANVYVRTMNYVNNFLE